MNVYSYLAEDYHLIGAKVVEFFHAASLFNNLQFAMKADDDTFVRVDALLSQLDNHRSGKLFLGCAINNMPPIRKKNNKRYYVAKEEYVAPNWLLQAALCVAQSASYFLNIECPH